MIGEIGFRKISKLNLLFALCMISLFFPITFIYPVLFLSFIVLTWLSWMNSRQPLWINWWQLFLFLFVGWALFISSQGQVGVDVQTLVKLVINMAFLASVPLYARMVTDRDFSLIFKVIELIMILTFLQILFLYLKLGIFSMLLSGGISNSSSAYVLTSNPALIFFGSEQKNIWATKVTFVQIAYILGITKGIYRVSKRRFYLFMGFALLNSLLGLGRTAQMAFLIPLGYLIWLEYLKSRNLFVKLSFPLVAVVGATYVLPKVFDKLFHISMSDTDGGYVRLIYWNTFLEHFFDERFILGNGILSASFFLDRYAKLYIGENNMHNVLLNMLLDWGVIGATLYLLFLFALFWQILRGVGSGHFLFFLLLPLVVILGLQYLGYDSDVVVFLGLSLLIARFKAQNKSTAGGSHHESLHLDSNVQR